MPSSWSTVTPLSIASYDLRDGLLPEEAAQISRLLGLAMTYDGHIAVAMPGIVAILDVSSARWST